MATLFLEQGDKTVLLIKNIFNEASSRIKLFKRLRENFVKSKHGVLAMKILRQQFHERCSFVPL